MRDESVRLDSFGYDPEQAVRYISSIYSRPAGLMERAKSFVI